MNLDFTFLDENQIFGENQLDILKIYGTRAAVTDFSILLGCYVSQNDYTSDGNEKKDRTGWWWTKSFDVDNHVIVIRTGGNRSLDVIYDRCGSSRPVLPYSSISKYASNIVVKNGIEEIEYGEYPQTVVGEDYSYELERLYITDKLKETGKTYTTDSINYHNYEYKFQARTHNEYGYKGSKYIRFIGDANGEGKLLSDGREVEIGKPYWLKVEPIIWLVDKKTDIALSKKLIFSGVQLNKKKKAKIDFENTDIKHFMDKYLSKDIIPSNAKMEYYYYTVKNFCGNDCHEVCIDIFPYGPEKFFIELMAYEYNGILRDLLTDIELVPDNANFIDNNVLTYNRLINANVSYIFERLLRLEDIKQQNELLLTKIKCEYIKYLSSLINNKDLIDTYNQALINKTVKDYLLLRRK